VGSRRKVGVGWLAVLVGVAVLMAALAGFADEECYEDVIVRGSGFAWVNVRLEFDSMFHGYPHFEAQWTGDGGLTYTIQLWYYDIENRWHLPATMRIDSSTYCNVVYLNDDVSSSTPPSTGWYQQFVAGCLCEGDGLPAPTLSGGEPCGLAAALIELLPAGLAGFLDRGRPEGEEPPVVGELVVSATYEVGELISGCCSLVDSSGAPVDVSYLTLSWYAVTIGDDFFDVREPIDSRLVYEEDGAFCFSIPTAEFAPGYYDIRLGAPFVDYQWIRVEVVAPAE